MVSPNYSSTTVPSIARTTFQMVAAVVMLLLFVVGVFQCVEWLDAKHVMVIQYPNGSLAAFSEPGPKPQWFGTITKYERRAQYEFDNDKTICAHADTKGFMPQRIRFAEGGHAHLCGALSWEMPTIPEKLFAIQKDFGSQYAIENALVSKALTNAIYFSGQMMTSTESSAERRGELLNFIEDQMKNGVYKTITRQERVVDPLTKQDRTINIIEILRDKDTKQPLRNNTSAISEYGITLVQTSISEIKYEKDVERQISDQQKAKADVQIAIANAITAEQNTRTIAEQGKATAAKAKWEQETIKAKVVTEGQQRLEVAELDKKTAEQRKQEQILLGQGEAERKRMVMAADGALEKKLEALVKINEMYASAIKDYKGNWVPGVVMGSSSGSNQGLALVDLLTAKTARDLGLDMTVPGAAQTRR